MHFIDDIQMTIFWFEKSKSTTRSESFSFNYGFQSDLCLDLSGIRWTLPDRRSGINASVKCKLLVILILSETIRTLNDKQFGNSTIFTYFYLRPFSPFTLVYVECLFMWFEKTKENTHIFCLNEYFCVSSFKRLKMVLHNFHVTWFHIKRIRLWKKRNSVHRRIGRLSTWFFFACSVINLFLSALLLSLCLIWMRFIVVHSVQTENISLSFSRISFGWMNLTYYS